MPKKLKLVITRFSIILSIIFVVWFSIFWAKNKYTFSKPFITINGASVLNKTIYIEYLKDIGIDSTNIKSDFILESLYKHPYIDAARLSHRYPNRIIIDISERSPFVMLNKDPMIMLDHESYVLPNIENIDDYNIPTLSKYNNASELYPIGKQSLSIKIKETISWLKKLNTKYPDLYNKISEITLESEDEIILILEENPTRIMLGNNNTFRKLEILKNFEKTLNNKKEITDYAYLDLRYDNQIIAKEQR
jgi:cell division septal protein FtsQ